MRTKEIDVWVMEDDLKRSEIPVRTVNFFNYSPLKARLIIELPEKSVTITFGNNKTEVLMNNITGTLKRNKRKYLVICRTGNNRPIDYVDATKDLEFLLKAKTHIEKLIHKAREGK